MIQLEVFNETVLLEQVDAEMKERTSVGQMVQSESVEIPIGDMLKQAGRRALVRLVHQHAVFWLHELEARPTSLVIFVQTEEAS
jgi:hypothetical protein